jgi:hypothetical protein
LLQKIHGDIAGVNNNDNMLFTGGNDTGDRLLAVSLLPAIDYWLCRCFQRKIIAGVVDSD